MNREAFQIYGLKKTGIFQSTWDTTKVSALGVEQAAISATGTNWALNTGATNLNVGGYKHTPGLTTNLTTTLSAGIMQMYKITYTISSRTAGSVTINHGGVSTSGITSSASVDILAIASTVFSITPTSDFDGVISISVKETSSATNQIKLPLPNSGTYNIWVDWGDGTYDNITSYNSIKTLHTYPASGEYTVKITGDRFSWRFGPPSTNDRAKIKTVSSWGKVRLQTYSFFGCSNVTMSGITDIPDLTGVTNFQYFFGGCSKITTIGRINEWNTSSVTIMTNTFDSCGNFNSNISNWDVSNVTSMSQMFYLSTKFNNGYASTIPNQLPWTINTTASSVNMNSMFNGATAFNSNLGTGTTPWNVSKVTTFTSMFQSASNFNNGSNTADINNWNIGGGITGTITLESMFQSASAFNREVGSWNVSKVTLMNNMFNVATAFNNGLAVGLPGTLAWNTIGVTTMRQMFDSATAFNCNVGGFNVSSCIDFGYMFRSATRFNNGGIASIADWILKTTGGIAMDAMFNNAIVFNQPIGSWNVSRVYTMFRMFGNSRFNQPIENWDVSNVNDMASMFEGDILFNQDLSKWNVGKVTTFASMFNNAAAFNNGLNTNTNLVTGLIGINGWNINTTAASVDMSYMFRSASAFNREVGSWNVSKVTLMNNMFFSAIAFNQPLANWERIGSTVGNMTNMSAMFQNASAFNQNIGNWNVSKVTTFVQMFQGSGFNNGGSPDINNWAINTTLGTNVNMSSMFSTTGSFNQPIGSWNVSNVTNFSNFMFGKTNLNFSATNLDAIYNGWIVNGVKPNLTNVNFGSAKYTSAGATGRAILTNPVGYNWTIIDGGQI